MNHTPLKLRMTQKFIKRNLESVNMQKYKNYEQIIIDGRSKDKTPIIVKKYMMKNLFLNT